MTRWEQIEQIAAYAPYNAQEAADALPGAKLRVTGRLQSRDYVKVVDGVSQTRTAYELSVTQAEFSDAPDFLEETAVFF